MNALTKRAALLAAVACPVLIGAQSASAALITQWQYQIDSAFTDFSEEAGDGSVVGSNPNTTLGNAPSTLTWGTGPQSSIDVTSDVDGPPPALETNGDAVPGATFSHNNQPIPAEDATLDTFVLTTQLQLTALDGEPGEERTVGPINFSSFFEESFNEESSEDCGFESESACDDIFVLSNADNLPAVATGASFTTRQNFTVEDRSYTAFLEIFGLGELSSDQCDAAGANSGCVGFLTQEGQLNQFDTEVRITSAEVPEPGTLALLGLGLAGLGFASRSRKF